MQRRTKVGLFSVLAGGAAACLLALIIWILPPRLIQGTKGGLTAADELAARNAVRTTLLQALGGAILVSGLYFTAKTLRLNREGQITERYSRSVEQLGHASIDVRLGAIFALERVARDSSADRSTVIEILTAFIREHTSATDPTVSTTRRVPLSDPVPTDVQAAITVIGRREVTANEARLDLTYTGLTGANFSGGSWKGANFDHSELGWCGFEEADLNGASFLFCNLQFCRFTRAGCRGARFAHATVYRGVFHRADLTDADFWGSDLNDSEFGSKGWYPATVRGADFGMSKLTGVDLVAVDLSETRNLSRERIEAANIDERTTLPPHLENQD